MGIIDDYYGGYESLGLFMDEDGIVDYEAAYEAQLPDADGYYDPDMDPWERAFDYKFNQVLRESALPGWSDTGRRTMAGKPIWEGSCSSCGKHTTVPFVPLPGGNPPCCKQCYAQSKPKLKVNRLDKQSRSRGKNKARNRGGASSSNAGAGNGSSSNPGGAGSSKAAEQQGRAAADASQPDQAL